MNSRKQNSIWFSFENEELFLKKRRSKKVKKRKNKNKNIPTVGQRASKFIFLIP